jgi:hypothetical protein
MAVEGRIYKVFWIFHVCESVYDGLMAKHKHLRDAYRFAGFTPSATVKGVFGDPKARIIELVRRQKKRPAPTADVPPEVFTIAKNAVFATSRAGICACFWNWRSGGYVVLTAKV